MRINYQPMQIPADVTPANVARWNSMLAGVSPDPNICVIPLTETDIVGKLATEAIYFVFESGTYTLQTSLIIPAGKALVAQLPNSVIINGNVELETGATITGITVTGTITGGEDIYTQRIVVGKSPFADYDVLDDAIASLDASHPRDIFVESGSYEIYNPISIAMIINITGCSTTTITLIGDQDVAGMSFVFNNCNIVLMDNISILNNITTNNCSVSHSRLTILSIKSHNSNWSTITLDNNCTIVKTTYVEFFNGSWAGMSTLYCTRLNNGTPRVVFNGCSLVEFGNVLVDIITQSMDIITIIGVHDLYCYGGYNVKLGTIPVTPGTKLHDHITIQHNGYNTPTTINVIGTEVNYDYTLVLSTDHNSLYLSDRIQLADELVNTTITVNTLTKKTDTIVFADCLIDTISYLIDLSEFVCTGSLMTGGRSIYIDDPNNPGNLWKDMLDAVADYELVTATGIQLTLINGITIIQDLGISSIDITYHYVANTEIVQTSGANIVKMQTNTIFVGPTDIVSEKMNNAISGMNVEFAIGEYANNIFVPNGVSIIGTGINCVLDADVYIEGTGNIGGFLLKSGHSVTRLGPGPMLTTEYMPEGAPFPAFYDQNYPLSLHDPIVFSKSAVNIAAGVLYYIIEANSSDIFKVGLTTDGTAIVSENHINTYFSPITEAKNIATQDIMVEDQLRYIDGIYNLTILDNLSVISSAGNTEKLASKLASASPGEIVTFTGKTITGDVSVPAGVTLLSEFPGGIITGNITLADGAKYYNFVVSGTISGDNFNGCYEIRVGSSPFAQFSDINDAIANAAISGCTIYLEPGRHTILAASRASMHTKESLEIVGMGIENTYLLFEVIDDPWEYTYGCWGICETVNNPVQLLTITNCSVRSSATSGLKILIFGNVKFVDCELDFNYDVNGMVSITIYFRSFIAKGDGLHRCTATNFRSMSTLDWDNHAVRGMFEIDNFFYLSASHIGANTIKFANIHIANVVYASINMIGMSSDNNALSVLSVSNCSLLQSSPLTIFADEFSFEHYGDYNSREYYLSMTQNAVDASKNISMLFIPQDIPNQNRSVVLTHDLKVRPVISENITELAIFNSSEISVARAYTIHRISAPAIGWVKIGQVWYYSHTPLQIWNGSVLFAANGKEYMFSSYDMVSVCTQFNADLTYNTTDHRFEVPSNSFYDDTIANMQNNTEYDFSNYFLYATENAS